MQPKIVSSGLVDIKGGAAALSLPVLHGRHAGITLEKLGE